jgi:23S rRNA (cytidine1920-2'-O)/16S rRNA (cytidine1409-2'-O)-methyltransferase
MKKRIDHLLHERGLAESLAKAQALVMAGQVYAGTKRVDKSSEMFDENAFIELKGKDHPYVSRGGVKLRAGLDYFNIDPAKCIALDVGASTGGFTDVLLRAGTEKVYAVDVGTNQLDYRLRQDARVVALEKINARTLDTRIIPEAPHIVVCDASFISLKTVLPAALGLAAPGAFLIALIKPQFEVAREQIGKGGIVRDESLHQQVCADIENWLNTEMGWPVLGITVSPITGTDGNREFLIAAQKPAED